MIGKGQVINGRYEIIRSIGEGGMANVYLAHDNILDRKVAIKVLRGDLSGDEKFVRRFQREALSASSLAHPNIVEMYDVGEDNGIFYIVMEYIEGKTLKQLLKKRGTLTLSEAIDIMLQLTDGMSHAHDSYIIHRDLKPQNIMIKDDGSIKITDFGIAMALNATQLTQTNSVMGSVHYLPPEQASGKGCTAKSDIYSMGIIFYELLSGALPFRGDNAVEIALKHMRDPLPSLKEENNAIPQSIENIIRRSTAKNPKNRYENVKEMHKDLLTALDDDRINEEEYKYKYPEYEDSKKKKPVEKEIKEEKVAEEVEDEEDKTKRVDKLKDKKKKKTIIILSIVFGVLVLAVIFIAFILPKLSNGESVKVPDCEGVKVSVCEKRLEEVGLVPATKVKSVYSNEIIKNKVIKTNPPEGKSVKKGTKVTIYKSKGEETYEIDDYVGQDLDEVRDKLEDDYGLYVTVEQKEVEKDEYEENKIIEQSIAKGTEVKKGDKITLYIGKEKAETLPNFADEGWSLVDVKSYCEERGISVTVEEVETSAYSAGTIISQSRKAGSSLDNVTTITVRVATAPKKKQETETDKDTETTE